MYCTHKNIHKQLHTLWIIENTKKVKIQKNAHKKDEKCHKNNLKKPKRNVTLLWSSHSGYIGIIDLLLIKDIDTFILLSVLHIYTKIVMVF